MYAFEGQDNELIEILINKYSEFNEVDDNGQNVAFYALNYGNQTFIETIFNNNVDFNAVDNMNLSLLMTACKNNNLWAVDQLIRQKVDPDVQDIDGNRAIMYAARSSSSDIIRSMLDYVGDVNILNNSNQSPLALALRFNMDNDTVSRIIDRSSDETCDLAFSTAGRYASSTSLNSLIRRGIKITVDVLINSILSYSTDKVSLLLDRVDRDLVNQSNNEIEDGFTPLIFAAIYGSNDIVNLLISSGADINYTTKQGYNAFYFACKNKNTSTAKLLLNNGSNI